MKGKYSLYSQCSELSFSLVKICINEQVSECSLEKTSYYLHSTLATSKSRMIILRLVHRSRERTSPIKMPCMMVIHLDL